MRTKWFELEERFRQIPDPHGDMRADWSFQTLERDRQLREQWSISAGLDHLSRASFEATAQLAGQLLNNGGMKDWLNEIFRRGNSRFDPARKVAYVLDNEKNVVGEIHCSSIYQVVQASIVTCQQLAAETRPAGPTPVKVETFGQRLRRLREERNWSQFDLQQKSGADKSQISKWENGKLQPRPKQLQELAQALGVTVPYLKTASE